jgi:GNAT superfamily N-acetyltransferase
LSPDLELEVFRGLSLNINHGGRRVGFIDAWEDEDVEGGVWVEYVYVLEGFRGLGFGSEAVRRAIARWGEMGFKVVSLDDIHWEESGGFWGGLGFRGEGKRKSLVIRGAPGL